MKHSSEGLMKELALGLALAVLLGGPLPAAGISRDPRELGTVVLKGLNVQDGKVIIRLDSGGCTDKAAIKANVQKEKGLQDKSPHYVVTFERVRADDCKAMLLEGTELEYDLADDLGIAGFCTLSVTNWIFPRSMASIAREHAIRAIEMEIRGCDERLKVTQSGLGPAGNAEKFKNRIAELKGQQETFQRMDPFPSVLGTITE